MTTLSKRKQLSGIIKNVENNLDIAMEQYVKTGSNEYQFQIKHYGSELKRLRDEVHDEERCAEGAAIRENLKLLSVGYGFVGKAAGEYIAPHIKQHVIIDPAHSTERIADHADAGAAIVAVPTPTVNGVCDDSVIVDVVTQLIAANPDIKILLKSTVPPDQLEKLPANVTYNPEFLRAKTAAEDFANQRVFILGGADGAYWQRVFSFMQGVEFIRTDRTTASMVKYMHNTWLAMKVAYFHEIYKLVGDSYQHDELISILAKFPNIGPSHMAMNDEGKLGYGGHCFPKDTEAFVEYTGSEILQKVIEINKKLIDNTQ